MDPSDSQASVAITRSDPTVATQANRLDSTHNCYQCIDMDISKLSFLPAIGFSVHSRGVVIVHQTIISPMCSPTKGRRTGCGLIYALQKDAIALSNRPSYSPQFACGCASHQHMHSRNQGHWPIRGCYPREYRWILPPSISERQT